VSTAGIVALVGADPPRLLARRSEIGYVDRVDLALPDEPEAVPFDYQARLAREARSRDRDTFVEQRDTIKAALDLLDGAGFAPISNDVRLMRRTLERMDRKLVA
jgi:hypothetical protein